MADKRQLGEVAVVFLKLGSIAFGGPAAHIAMMQQEVVTKRKWLSNEGFLDLLGATNLIPGPNSTEMAIHIGKERAGWKGLITAGICFILPAVLITGTFAWLYQNFGSLPDVKPFIYGIKPVIIAIIVAAVLPLAKKSLKSQQLYFIGLLVLTGTILEIGELYLLFGAGFLAILLFIIGNRNGRIYQVIIGLIPIHYSLPEATVSNSKLFLIFLKIGSILYGSGYVLFAFLDSELVATGLLPRATLIDAIAVGQFTPGPVFSAVTFIGYQLNGFIGAAVATIGVFLPSFFFVALLNPIIKILRNSLIFAVFLDAVNVASIAIIIGVCYFMSKEVITDWRTITIGSMAILILLKFKKINSAVVIAGGSLLGYLFSLL